MRVLLDECLPANLRLELPGHDVTTVQRMGWAGTRNGALLVLAAGAGFAAFMTIDKGIAFQQRWASLPFGVIALRADSNDIADLRRLMPMVLIALRTLGAGQLVHIP